MLNDGLMYNEKSFSQSGSGGLPTASSETGISIFLLVLVTMNMRVRWVRSVPELGALLLSRTWLKIQNSPSVHSLKYHTSAILDVNSLRMPSLHPCLIQVEKILLCDHVISH